MPSDALQACPACGTVYDTSRPGQQGCPLCAVVTRLAASIDQQERLARILRVKAEAEYVAQHGHLPGVTLSRCARQGCENDGTIDVDTVFGSVYVCEDHFDEARA